MCLMIVWIIYSIKYIRLESVKVKNVMKGVLWNVGLYRILSMIMIFLINFSDVINKIIMVYFSVFSFK